MLLLEKTEDCDVSFSCYVCCCVSIAVSTGRNIKEEANLANGIRKSVLDEFRSGKFSFQEKDSESALIQTIEERFAALYSHHYS